MENPEIRKQGVIENLGRFTKEKLKNPLLIVGVGVWLSVAGISPGKTAGGPKETQRSSQSVENVSNRELRKLSDTQVHALMWKSAQTSDSEEVVWQRDGKWEKPDARKTQWTFDVNLKEFTEGKNIREIHTHPAENAPPSVGDIERAMIIEALFPGKFDFGVIDQSGNNWDYGIDETKPEMKSAMDFVRSCIPKKGNGEKRIRKTIETFQKKREKDLHNSVDLLVDKMLPIYVDSDLHSFPDDSFVKVTKSLNDLKDLGVSIVMQNVKSSDQK